HEQRQSTDLPHAWATPVRAVGTDPKMATNAARTSDPGIYLGALRPPPAVLARFTNPASTAEMLGTSVIGSILGEAFDLPITPQKIDQSGVWRAIQKDLDDLLPDEKLDAAAKIKAWVEIKARLNSKLANMFVKPRGADPGA